MSIWSKDDIARIIISVGQEMGVSPRGITIGLTTGLVESNLVVYGNAKVPGSLVLPHDAVGSDGMSVGVQQQQVRNTGNGWWWGPVEVCQDPRASTRLFYDRLVKLDYNSDSHSPGWYAQTIQKSAFGGRYDERWSQAVDIYNRLAGSAPAPIVGVLRGNVEFAKRIFADRLGDPYIYGGNWDPFNVKTGTDCSGLVGDILDACLHGTAMAWRRQVTTESWPPNAPLGARGPFGTIRINRASDAPKDAAAVVAIHHGGGGASSHTNISVDGVLMESSGSHGTCGADSGAIPQTSNYWTDFHFLPGPIVGDAGIPPSQGVDDLSAEAERQISVIYQELTKRFPSRSPLRHVGEGPLDTLSGFVLNADGSTHVEIVKTLAGLGHPPSLALLREVAGADPVQFPDRQGDRDVARAILADVTAPKAVNGAQVVYRDAPVDTRALDAAHAEIARLRDENMALRAELASTPNLPAVNGADVRTSGDRVGQLVDSVEDWTDLALSMDVKQRAALAAFINVLEMPNNGGQA